MTKKKVEIIEPIAKTTSIGRKLNVAAYARVSTGFVEQKDSFENQKRYYEQMIKSNLQYNFVGVFADEAISGTTDARPEFQRMITLAKNGYIDIIYTKSISRFSRNVKDLLDYCKDLKDHGVDVVFEENGLRLLDSTGSLMLTILGAVAQMEVENTSAHVQWTMNKRMEEGKLVGQPNPLGYDIVDGKLVVNEKEAEIVRYIFKRYLEGIGCSRIAKELHAMGAKTKRDNSNWCSTTVMGIIKNEKYIGTLLQGKTYTVDTVEHKRKDNKGEARFYKLPDNHEPIISVEDWEKAQEITDSRCISYVDGRKKGTTNNAKLNTFTSKLTCAYCGKNFVRRKVHAGTKYEKVVWKCTTKCKQGAANCPHSVAIEEDFLKKSVVLMIKDLIDDDGSMFYLSNNKLNSLIKQSEKKKDKIEEQIIKCQRSIEATKKKKSKLLDKYLEDRITEQDFNEHSQSIDNEIASSNKLLEELTSIIGRENKKDNSVIQISKLINEGKAEGFSEELFNLIIDRIKIGGKRIDGVDDPRSLHFALNAFNLETGMITKVDENGVLRYTTDSDMSDMIIENDDNTDDKSVENCENVMCSLDCDNTRGNSSLDVPRVVEAIRLLCGKGRNFEMESAEFAEALRKVNAETPVTDGFEREYGQEKSRISENRSLCF